jgi:glycosyltransferase involved in cell wall biosynthesis
MKLIFVGNGLLDTDCYPIPNQGGSVQTWELARELAKRGHEVFIIRRSNIEGKEIVERVNLVSLKFKGFENVIRARFMSLPFYATRIFSSLYFSKKSKEVIQKISPDIICLIDMFSGIFPSSLNIRKLYIIHVPDALDFFKPYSIYTNKLNSIMFYIKKSLQNSIMLKVEKIVVLNSYIEKYLRNGGSSNVVKIPNGIDTKEFVNRGDERFILYAGRFDWNKNVCSLVNAFAEIHKSYPNYGLYLVGAGPEEKRISSLVKEKGLQSGVKIISWMPRNRLINLMGRCAFFVLPSYFEVFPVVILEAMASGKPVIARSNMGSAEAIVHGQNGFLYEREDEMTRYIELLISDGNLRGKMGSNARRIVEEKYSFEKIADDYINLFENILNEDR